MIRRETQWQDARSNVFQVSVAYLDHLWEPQVDVTEAVGPFETVSEARARCERVCRQLCWQLSQLELEL